ncbi:nucleotidyltransferase family protein [Mucilaginibacter sp. HMF5004]|uniref:nucleotidyltransferase family protein n=1 Tax=Mucilaginibacter rivuli TaxID=2857527 RepID=UPI001C5E0D05|nr:nucleotidyltransferase family protein [Mucilaginibacter rivuli]MBW4889070.1 nucleotidyltransferase family protein [Mucilaginibacter rivuli]
MIGLIILAAGESSRMGQPKQQLPYKGKSLLQHAMHTALSSVCKPVVVVLGAYADEISREIKSEPVTIIHNQEWQEGMASSIRLGIAELEKDPQISSVVIMLCDQPFVDTTLVNELVNQQKNTRKGIIACSYNDTIGVPVLFTRIYFERLMLLQGTEGAKKILTQYPHDMAVIPFAPGSIDIDTQSDYDNLM